MGKTETKLLMIAAKIIASFLQEWLNSLAADDDGVDAEETAE